MATSQDVAHAAIRDAVDPGDCVRMTGGKLSPKTAATLGLLPGVVMRM